MKPSLDALGVRFGTDQSSIYHNYLTRIEPYLATLPDAVRLLEIGVLHGRSISVWLEYFPQGQIHGVDLVSAHNITNPRFTFHLNDAIRPSFWDGVGRFDVILDDGNHDFAQVLNTYNQGFNHVNPGGLYILEDTCKTNFHVADLMRPSFNELQGHDRDWCGDPARDGGRMSFIHFYKGLILIGRK